LKIFCNYSAHHRGTGYTEEFHHNNSIKITKRDRILTYRVMPVPGVFLKYTLRVLCVSVVNGCDILQVLPTGHVILLPRYDTVIIHPDIQENPDA
jgi:hypothetical protein